MRRLSNFLARRDGSIAVEFALIAPIMIGLFFGLSELALALGAKGDVTNLASVGADLIAQESSATTSDMSNVFDALSAMLYPYSTTNAQITISSVLDNSSGGTTGNANPTGNVAWSCTQGGTARTANSTYSFPAAAQGVVTSGSGGSVIVAEVTYTYSMSFAASIPGVTNLSGPYTFTNTFYSKPRKVLQVSAPSACP
jgi:Flp pilus assembly protein TadG